MRRVKIFLKLIDISNTITFTAQPSYQHSKEHPPANTFKMIVSPRLAEVVKRSMSPNSVVGPDSTSPHSTDTSNSSHNRTLSTGGAIALTVSFGVLVLLLCLAMVYFIYWRDRKGTPQPELEVGEDGSKVTMQVEREQRRWWWGRRGRGTSQNTLVRDDGSTRGSVAVRNDA